MRKQSMLRMHVLAVAATLGLMMSACGGGDNGQQGAAPPTTEPVSSETHANDSTSGGAANSTPDGCALVTEADAETVLGGPVTRDEEATVPQQLLTSCLWNGGPGSSALVDKMLQLYVYDGTSYFAPSTFESMPGFETIAGLGDGAYAVGSGSFDLTVLTGDRTVFISVSGFAPDDREQIRQAVLKLAPQVLNRM
jgi:hypothetical protein